MIVSAVLAVLVVFLVYRKAEILEAHLAKELDRICLDLDEAAERHLLAVGAPLHLVV